MTVQELLVKICAKENVLYIENGLDSPLRRFFQAKNIQCIDSSMGRILKSEVQVEYFYVFSMYEPLTYLRELLRFYYLEGAQTESFDFFQVFFRTVNQYDFTKESDIEAFVKWLVNQNIRTLYDPQVARIDLKKNLKTLKQNTQLLKVFIPEEVLTDLLKREYGIFERNEKATTPFDTFKIEKYESLFSPFVQKDKILYRLAVNTMGKMLESESIDKVEKIDLITEVEGLVNEISSDSVAGWVFAKGHPPLNVVLFVNEIHTMRTTAIQYRAGIHKAGKHPDGKCGFVFRLDTIRLSADDVIRIEVEETGEPVHIMRKAMEFFQKE